MWEPMSYGGGILNLLVKHFLLCRILDFHVWPAPAQLAYLCIIFQCILVLLRLKNDNMVPMDEYLDISDNGRSYRLRCHRILDRYG
ncbi:hypothetical protein CPB86DRAFT_788293 [Serendipita vermifera]|nr:hypothetical protein CPB86DRAFT_788293 [Serendipita vermifera]